MLDAIHSGLTIFEYFYHIPCIPGISSYIYVGTLKSLRDFYKLLSLTAITSLLNCFVDFVQRSEVLKRKIRISKFYGNVTYVVNKFL